MRFSALPVNEGDSFLLKTNGHFILVDGGKNKCHIITLLNNECIPQKHINVIICTHYDADHINGIFGILKSRKYTFDEIWLPEILGSISYTITKKLQDILDYLRKQEDVFDGVDTSDALELIFKEHGDSDADDDSNIINYSTLESILKMRYKVNTPRIIHNMSREMGSNLYRACSVVMSSSSTGARVRWFKYQNRVVNINYGFNMYSQNAIETGITIYSTPEIFLQALSLTRINKYSLVFMYRDGDEPNVLFTADSDLSFSHNPIQLNENSIVTAPHHGAETNKQAYSKITGNNLYYVRSDKSQTKRPCANYLKQLNRFCTICRNMNPKQKVSLEFNNGAMIIIANKCCC